MGRTKTTKAKSQKPPHEVRRQAVFDALLARNVPPDIARYVAAIDEEAIQAERDRAALLRNILYLPPEEWKKKRKKH
jgi:hypothetical protein